MKKVIVTIAHSGQALELFTDNDTNVLAGLTLLVQEVTDIELPAQTDAPQNDAPVDTQSQVENAPVETVAETAPVNADPLVAEAIAESDAKELSTTAENDGTVTNT